MDAVLILGKRSLPGALYLAGVQVYEGVSNKSIKKK
jgi:hypothetical protein